MAKETNDDDAENPTENSQYGGKVVRVIKSSNSFASAIGSMLGLGFGQSDVPNPTEKAKDSDSNASEEDVQDSVSEPERDDSFEIGSAKTEYEQDVQEDDSISVQSSSSVEDAKEGDSVGMSSDSEKSVQVTYV